MEESITGSLTESIWKEFGLNNLDPKQMSPLVLAYIGDSVFDVVIKSYVVEHGNVQVNKMNKMTSNIVKAESQSVMIGFIEDELSEEELGIYKRGRNAKSYTKAKNASVSDYRRATGYEALVGYLYLQGRYDRLAELIHMGITRSGSELEK